MAKALSNDYLVLLDGTHVLVIDNRHLVLFDAEHLDRIQVDQWRSVLGYAQNSSGEYLHRLVMADELAPGLLVDHISRDRSDSRRANLRMATPEQSQLNRSAGGNPDLPRGVRRHGSGFRAYARIRGARTKGPLRETAEEAGRDWDEMMRAGHPPENWPFIQWNAVTSHFAGSRNSPEGFVASFGNLRDVTKVAA